MKTKGEALLTCPDCEHKQHVDIPQDGCLAFYQCNSCENTVSVPDDSDDCCVICAYSDTTCPVGE